MIHPRIDELLNVEAGGVDSRYALVIVAAKRARQINNYHHQLGEGMGFEEAPPPLVESRSKNYLTMALEEIAQGKIKYDYGALARSPSPPHGARPVAVPGAPCARVCGHDGGWRASCSGSPAASRPTRPASSCACSSRRGHDVLPLPTRGAERFVRAETFFALARKSPSDRSVSAPGARRPARRRAAHGEHAREARARARRRRPHRGGARAPRARARRAGDEHAHVGARGDPGERGHSARAWGRADRARGGRARGRRGRASAG